MPSMLLDTIQLEPVQAEADGPDSYVPTLGDVVELRKFTTRLGAALATGAGALADADPAAEATNLRALKAAQAGLERDTQPQALLSLFRSG